MIDSSDPIVSVREDAALGGVWRITLNRPDARNALNARVADAIARAVDATVAAGGALIVFDAAGPVFCAGADLKDPGSGATEQAIDIIAGSPVPWLAAVRGPAVGAGVALVAVCTFSVLSAEAWMSLPEVTAIGRYPVGVSAWLERFCGMRALLDVGLSGRRISPESAVALGWATETVPTADFDDAVLRKTAELRALPSDVLAQAQQSWRRWLERGDGRDRRVTA